MAAAFSQDQRRKQARRPFTLQINEDFRNAGKQAYLNEKGGQTTWKTYRFTN
jgi:hypothetical protein